VALSAKELREQKELLQGHYKALTGELKNMQAAINSMCRACAGDDVADGGTCWDKQCPLRKYSVYPLKKSQ